MKSLFYIGLKKCPKNSILSDINLNHVSVTNYILQTFFSSFLTKWVSIFKKKIPMWQIPVFCCLVTKKATLTKKGSQLTSAIGLFLRGDIFLTQTFVTSKIIMILKFVEVNTQVTNFGRLKCHISFYGTYLPMNI